MYCSIDARGISGNRHGARKFDGASRLSFIIKTREPVLEDLSEPRILVVDDNDDNRFTLTLYLELEGYSDLSVAENGEQAIAKLTNHDFDLVLLDVMMPGVDGYQVLTWMKSQRRFTDVPVIMISAADEMSSMIRCIELGAVDYLQKPFNQRLLRARLGSCLGEKRLRDQINAHLARLEQEIKAARDLQMSMLPQVFPEPTRQFPIDIHGHIQPAREVGGDLYDFFSIDGELLCFFVGDVSGKGMPAALFMARTKSLVRVVTEFMNDRSGSVSPADVVGRVNRELCQNNSDMMFVTLFFGLLKLETGEVWYCNAGHNPPYRIAGETVAALDDGKGIMLGVQPEARYQTGMLTLMPGDALYLFSDGVTEAIDATGALFSDDRLEAALYSVRGQSSRAIVETVNDKLRTFVGPVGAFDDITMLALRRVLPRPAGG